jgi:hypothetical protein
MLPIANRIKLCTRRHKQQQQLRMHVAADGLTTTNNSAIW